MAKTAKANCEHKTNTRKFIKTAREENTGWVLLFILVLAASHDFDVIRVARPIVTCRRQLW